MVRCGRCKYCRIRRKQAWVGRLRLELQDHRAARFLTLTYAEDPGELSPEDLQLFLKRYRRDRTPCRFFAVGEYGEKSGRGHWHALIFGHPPQALGHLQGLSEWPHGYAYDGEVNAKSIGYVAGYTMKGAREGDLHPIVRMSLRPGIGFRALERAGSAYARSLGGRQAPIWPSALTIGGKRYPLSEGGLLAFQRAFLDSGGSEPTDLTPEQRHAVALTVLGEFGTRIEAAQKFNRKFMYNRGLENGAARTVKGAI